MSANELAVLHETDDGPSYELVDGELFERHTSAEAVYVRERITDRLLEYLSGKDLGCVFSSRAVFKCFPNEKLTMRKPWISFIRMERFKNDLVPRGHFLKDDDFLPDAPIVMRPDLVIEVICSRDLVVDLDRKVHDFRKVGVEELWVVIPNVKIIEVFYPDGSGRRLGLGETVSCNVIPGFKLNMTDFFRRIK